MTLWLFLTSSEVQQLHKDIDNQTVYIQGYNIYRSDRASRGGGVAVYVKSTYAAAILSAVSIPKYL